MRNGQRKEEFSPCGKAYIAAKSQVLTTLFLVEESAMGNVRVDVLVAKVSDKSRPLGSVQNSGSLKPKHVR